MHSHPLPDDVEHLVGVKKRLALFVDEHAGELDAITGRSADLIAAHVAAEVYAGVIALQNDLDDVATTVVVDLEMGFDRDGGSRLSRRERDIMGELITVADAIVNAVERRPDDEAQEAERPPAGADPPGPRAQVVRRPHHREARTAS